MQTIFLLFTAQSDVQANVCYPSPCGQNSQCREINGQAVCSCLPNYFGQPPSCRPECVLNSGCPSDKACINQNCVNPCPGPCGQNAQCRVFNHNPICSCDNGFTGDAFTRCYRKPIPQPVLDENRNPCVPSPCGMNSQCREIGNQPSCSCNPGYLGSPPNCRPECVTNQDCLSSMACLNERCVDPCPGSCGQNARCSVINHVSMCTCIDGYKGDPFTLCTRIPLQGKIHRYLTLYPCHLSAINVIIKTDMLKCIYLRNT